MKKVLIVDDEKTIVESLKIILEYEGYATDSANDGEAALAKYREFRPDLILLDVMLPRLDGFEVCRRIRENDNHTPIIMITARAEETDTVMGLDIGADDYIVKPYKNSVVLARVRANMRRLSDEPFEQRTTDEELYIDDERYDVFVRGVPAQLTQREFELVKYLASSAGHVFSREELLHDVWQYDYVGDTRAVDVAIARLRTKIEDNPAEPRYIMTKRKVGYYFGSGE